LRSFDGNTAKLYEGDLAYTNRLSVPIDGHGLDLSVGWVAICSTCRVKPMQVELNKGILIFKIIF